MGMGSVADNIHVWQRITADVPRGAATSRSEVIVFNLFLLTGGSV